MAKTENTEGLGGKAAEILADMFEHARWRVRYRLTEPLLLFSRGSQKYAARVRAVSEGRSDRLIPLLAQVILEARDVAAQTGAVAPLAVVAARRVPPRVVTQLAQFAKQYAPGAAIGIVDLEGLRFFRGPGLENFDSAPPRRRAKQLSQQRLPDLFSDLNQWMLKVLLGQLLPENLIAVPRRPIRNASQLAAAAEVSVMTATRCVNQLARQGFLEDDSDGLQVVRIPELLELWVAANRNAAKEQPARWLHKRGREQMFATLREYPAEVGRCCGGLFLSAGVLGFSMVSGTLPCIYLERLDATSVQRLGITLEITNRVPELYLRVPSNPEAIFRARVQRNGVPVTDVLQTWLDVSTHPGRGREQANQIQRRALKPLFER